MNQRELALEILYKSIKEESYSNLLMRSRLKLIPQIQRSFVVNLVNTSLRNFNYLLYQIDEYISNKTNLKLKCILVLALCEKYLFHEKPYVYTNEYVKLTSNKYESSFINAVLRKDKPFNTLNDNTLENIAIKYSLDLWLCKLLFKQYPNQFNEILKTINTNKPIFYRINPNKFQPKHLKEINVKLIDNRYFVSDVSLIEHRLFKQGYFYIQDINAGLLVDALELKENDVFLDVCAAPGSKLFNALDIIKQENAFGNDINEKRVNLIRQKANLLGYHNITLLNYDGCDLPNNLDIKFDKILLDVPCSGIGIIARKPDIRFHIKMEQLDELEIIQKKLLNNNSLLLKQGGTLVYSTCTLNKKENEKQVAEFLKNNQEFSLIKQETIINDLGDCFYFAALKRN